MQCQMTGFIRIQILEEKIRELETKVNLQQNELDARLKTAKEVVLEELLKELRKTYPFWTEPLVGSSLQYGFDDPLVGKLILASTTALNREDFIYKFLDAQLECILLKDIRQMRWATHPEVCLWCSELVTLCGKGQYDHLLRGAGHQNEDKRFVWHHNGSRQILYLPSSKHLTDHESLWYEDLKKPPPELLSKFFQTIKAANVDLEDMTLLMDASDHSRGVSMPRIGDSRGIVGGLTEEIEGNAFPEYAAERKRLDDWDAHLTSKAIASVLASPNADVVLPITVHFALGEDHDTVQKILDDVTGVLEPHGVKITHLTTDGAPGYQSVKKSNTKITKGTSVIHCVKNGVCFSDGEGGMKICFQYTVKPIEFVLNSSQNHMEYQSSVAAGNRYNFVRISFFVDVESLKMLQNIQIQLITKLYCHENSSKNDILHTPSF